MQMLFMAKRGYLPGYFRLGTHLKSMVIDRWSHGNETVSTSMVQLIGTLDQLEMYYRLAQVNTRILIGWGGGGRWFILAVTNSGRCPGITGLRLLRLQSRIANSRSSGRRKGRNRITPVGPVGYQGPFWTFALLSNITLYMEQMHIIYKPWSKCTIRQKEDKWYQYFRSPAHVYQPNYGW